tara:strand:- start:963 stop:1196 length:234 start_codon:yes stop_codon:yes gene_type:complete
MGEVMNDNQITNISIKGDYKNEREELITRKQACDLGGISRQRVSKVLQEYNIGHVKFGLLPLIVRREWEEYLRNRRR